MPNNRGKVHTYLYMKQQLFAPERIHVLLPLRANTSFGQVSIVTRPTTHLHIPTQKHQTPACSVLELHTFLCFLQTDWMTEFHWIKSRGLLKITFLLYSQRQIKCVILPINQHFYCIDWSKSFVTHYKINYKWLKIGPNNKKWSPLFRFSG